MNQATKPSFIVYPLAVTLGFLVLYFFADGMPLKELFGIWIPWTAIMLSVSAILFGIFYATLRFQAWPLRFLGSLFFLLCALFGLIVFLAGGDRLSGIPITLHGMWSLFYAITILWQTFARDFIISRRTQAPQ